jgi:hypothetical protein
MKKMKKNTKVKNKIRGNTFAGYAKNGIIGGI